MSSRKSSRRSADDFVEEIRSHLALEADELEASGVAKEEAERRARASFGSVAAARERFNLRGRILWLDDLLHDVRFGIRMLLRNPALSIVAALVWFAGFKLMTLRSDPQPALAATN